MNKELLKQALDALENPALPVYTTLRKDIRIALAQPQAEPVAEVRAKSDAYGGTFVQWYSLPVAGMKLYATPQQAQPTENPWKDAVLDRLASASIDAPTDEFPSRILDRIIEVEVMIALAHVPDGWVMVPKELFPSQRIAAIVAAIQASDSNLVCSADEVSAVYRAMIAASPAAPVVREPLSHKHLLELHAPLAVSLPSGWEWWARVIERAHGITGGGND